MPEQQWLAVPPTTVWKQKTKSKKGHKPAGVDGIKNKIALALAVMLVLTGCGASAQSASSSDSSAASVSAASSAVASVAPQPRQAAVPPGTNPLSGLAAAEGFLDGQRPAAVTVMNSQRSLPQRGLAAADILMEMLIDSAETRLLALYGDYRAVPQVGPVGATYDQFVQMALPLDAIEVHIDKSQYAENLLTVMQQKDIDGIHLGKVAFWFDEGRQMPRLTGKLNEYCWYTDANLIYAGMTYIDVPTVGPVPALFDFGDKTNFAPGLDAYQIQGVFSGQCASGFSYSPDLDSYAKSNYGAAHTDEDGTPLTYQNVLFLQVNMAQKPDSGMWEYDYSKGTGWYFTSGSLQRIQWTKGEPQAPLCLTDQSGETLKVKPGKSYIGFVSAGQENAVTWQSFEQVQPPAVASVSPVSTVPSQL